MEYKGYKIEQKDNKVIVEKVEDLTLSSILTAGSVSDG